MLEIFKNEAILVYDYIQEYCRQKAVKLENFLDIDKKGSGLTTYLC
jgi:hypothetical protein